MENLQQLNITLRESGRDPSSEDIMLELRCEDSLGEGVSKKELCMKVEEGRRGYGNSGPSAQFFRKSDTVLKNKGY